MAETGTPRGPVGTLRRDASLYRGAQQAGTITAREPEYSTEEKIGIAVVAVFSLLTGILSIRI